MSLGKFSVGVIGAGIQGVCCGLFLIKKGFAVTLLTRMNPEIYQHHTETQAIFLLMHLFH